ncbi:hypothetical protein Tco_1323062 [Tanacetum coccineum]
MAVLESCPKHNMVAYLEKTDGNAEFHEIIDFLTRSSIHHALTISSVVSTTFVEQFWTFAKSTTINNVRHITAKVAGKPVSISEASIRSALLFDDADGIDSLPNQAIFDAIQLMGYEGDLTDEGAPSERPSKAQPTPFPPHTSEAPVEPQSDPSPRPLPSPTIPDSFPESSGGNLGGHSSSDKSLSGNESDMTLQSVYDLCISLCTQVLEQAKEIQKLKAQIKNLKKQAKPVITHYRAWMKSVSLQQRLAGKRSLKKNWMHKENEFTDEQIEGSGDQEKSTDDHTEGERATQTTQTPTSTIFRDDETIAQVLINMSQAKAVSREKEKGVEFKDIEETERPRPTLTRSLLTLKPLPKIDPKDKGKKKIEEEDESESE